VSHHGGYALLLVLGLGVGYGVLAAGSARPWSRWRTASFMSGCLLLMLAAVSGHDDASFAAGMRQHLLVGMLAPSWFSAHR
jgi:putative membrane protein